MSLISSYCEVEQDRIERFMNAPKDTELYELKRLAQEVNATFGLEVVSMHNETAFRPGVNFVTANGIKCGSASVVKDGTKDGKKVFRYYLTMPTIRKDKSSANSGRDSRDSTTLSTLIRTIKKNKEEPTIEKLLNVFQDGMKYAMRSVERAGGDTPTLRFDTETSAAVARYVLGIDAAMPHMYIDSLREKFDQYQSQMQSHQEANRDFTRFARGVTLVGIVRENEYDNQKPHYLVVDATFNAGKYSFEFQGDLKRYNSLADSPIADIAVMVKTHMMGMPHYDSKNDLGVLLADRYYNEIDISTGYTSRDCVWVAIPKHAQ